MQEITKPTDLITQEDKKFKQTDKLIKAVIDLDKRLKGDGKGIDGDGKKTGFFGTLKAGIAGKLRNMFSPAAILERVAGTGMIGTALAAGKELKAGKQEKIAETQRKAEAFLEHDPGGKEHRKDADGGMGWATKRVLEREGVESDVARMEANQKEANSVGLDISEDEKGKLAAARRVLDPFDKAKKVDKNPRRKSKSESEAPVAPVDPLVKVRAQVEKRGDPLEQALLAKYDKQQAEKATSSVEAPPVASPVDSDNNPDKESEDIQLKQLAALETLVANSVTSEEDRLESKKPETNTVVKEQKKPEEKSGGLIDSLLGAVKNLLPSVGGLLAKAGGVAAKGAAALAPIAGKLLAMAGPAAAVAGAGAAGYAVGKYVVNPLLDKGAEAITGEKGATVGTAIYKGVDKVAGWFGGSDADKSADADKKSEIDLVMKTIGDNKPVSAQLLEKVGKYDLTPEQRQTLSKATVARKITPIEKQAETPREVQATQLEQNTNRSKEIEQKKAEGTTAPPATIVNNTNVSQVTNQTKITPPVRNQDPTYNDRLRATFA